MATSEPVRTRRPARPAAAWRHASLAWATALVALAGAAASCCSPPARAASSNFRLDSPDLASGSFDTDFMLAGFGCSGKNVSPALSWSHAPAGTLHFAVQMIDLDASTGSGFWHWAVYDLPAKATGLPRGAGNREDSLPSPGYSGNTDFRDTGVPPAGVGYAGPCPPRGDRPHRYRITLYAYAAPSLAAAGGIPRSGTPALYSFVLNKGLGDRLLARTSLVATSRR